MKLFHQFISGAPVPVVLLCALIQYCAKVVSQPHNLHVGGYVFGCVNAHHCVCKHDSSKNCEGILIKLCKRCVTLATH